MIMLYYDYDYDDDCYLLPFNVNQHCQYMVLMCFSIFCLGYVIDVRLAIRMIGNHIW